MKKTQSLIKTYCYIKTTGYCCFCKKHFNGLGNSTKPIYYKEDGEQYRCCDECNKKYVIPARTDKSLIMTFRNQFGIDYTKYDE